MAFNPIGAILCKRCETFVDGRDCIKCGWTQEPYLEDPKDKLIRLVQQGIDDLYATGADCEARDLKERLEKLLEEINK